jgi:hypothetical protein
MSDDVKDNKLAIVPTHSGALEPTTLGQLATLAGKAASTGFFGAQTEEQALLLMMAGKDIGFSYTQSLRAFQLIKGKPSLSASAMVAVCLNSGKCEFFRCLEKTNTSVTFETKRRGNPARTLTFTIQDAQAAGLVNDMYRKYPRQMLSARCQAELAREVYPELLMGLYDPDELTNTGTPTPIPPPKVDDAIFNKDIAVVAQPILIPDAEIEEEDIEEPPSEVDEAKALEEESQADAFKASIIESATLEKCVAVYGDAKSALASREDLLAEIRKVYSTRYKELKAGNAE